MLFCACRSDKASPTRGACGSGRMLADWFGFLESDQNNNVFPSKTHWMLKVDE